jgi:hypothetical protein
MSTSDGIAFPPPSEENRTPGPPADPGFGRAPEGTVSSEALPTPPPPGPARNPASGRFVVPILGAVVAVGIGLVGGIFIGQNTAQAQNSTAGGVTRQFGAGGAGAGGGVGAFAAGGFTSGTVVSVSGDSVVIKTAAGTDVTVRTTSTTKVTKQATTRLSALAAGERVTAVGTPGTNGAITATTISEGTTLRGGFGRGAGGGAGAGAGAGG